MLQISDDIAARFEMAMGAGGVGDAVRPHLRKWLRFYLDCCAKYGFESSAEPSFPQFDAKLQEKGQADWKRRQAFQAVGLYRQSLSDKGASDHVTLGRVSADATAIAHGEQRLDTGGGGMQRESRSRNELRIPPNRVNAPTRAPSMRESGQALGSMPRSDTQMPAQSSRNSRLCGGAVENDMATRTMRSPPVRQPSDPAIRSTDDTVFVSDPIDTMGVRDDTDASASGLRPKVDNAHNWKELGWGL